MTSYPATFHSMRAFEQAVMDSVRQWCHDTFENLPDISEPLKVAASGFCSTFTYPSYAVIGLSREQYANIISEVMNEVHERIFYTPEDEFLMLKDPAQ